MEHPHASHLRGHVAVEERTVTVAHRGLCLAVLCLAIFISAVDTTVVNVALPEISADLGATTAQLQWVMDAYTVVLAGLILLGGGLADRFGRKRVFCLGLGVFAVTSLFAAYAGSPEALIVSRAGMGLGAALIFPPALSLIAVIFPPKERRRAVAIWSLVAGLGVALGPLVGGVLLDHFSWGSVFLVNVPVTVGGLVCAVVLLPASRRPGSPPLDVIGGALSVAALGGVVYAIIQGPDVGWGDPEIVGALVVGLLALGGFVWWELRCADPLFDVRVLADRVVLAGFSTLLLFYVAFLGIEFVVPQYLQSVQGLSTITAGLAMLCVGVLNPPASLMTPRLMERFGPGPLILASLVGVAAVGLTLTQMGSAGLGLTVVAMFVLGACMGLGFPPATATVMNALPLEKAGDGSAVNQVGRQVGAALGIAIIGSVLGGAYTHAVQPATAALPPAKAEVADSSIEGAHTVASQLPVRPGATLDDAADDAFDDAAQAAMLTVVGVAAGAALAVFVLLRRTSAMRPIPPD